VNQNSNQTKKQNEGRWKLFAVLAVCAFPLIASYFTYYIIKPQSRNNYGTLIDPRLYPIPQLGTATLDGKPLALDAYKGKWIMLQVGDSECPDACKKQLFEMRQLRLMQGKEMDRIERVWLITDDKPVETTLIRQYDGMHIMRARVDALKAWLPVEPNTTIADHIYLIDPLGNLMMRFPKDSDPNKVKKDLSKLLKASSIG
jgi:cytochrome oxidase Cu insertion factor (SCO1/SenC/PrrC family)